MRPLGRRLEATGHWQARYFQYPTRKCAPKDNARALVAYINTLDDRPIDVVAHSLGGIVFCHALKMGMAEKISRWVLLGSPVKGSRVARLMDRLPGVGSVLLGNSRRHGLLGGAPLPRQTQNGAVFSGALGIGLGTLMLLRHKPHDGLVCVSETAWPEGPTPQLMSATHASLLFSRSVCDRVLAHLKVDDPPAD